MKKISRIGYYRYEGMDIQPSGVCTLTYDTPTIPAVDFYLTTIDTHPILGLTDCLQPSWPD